MKNTSIQRKIWTSFSSVLLLGFLLVGIIVPALVRHYAKQTAAYKALRHGVGMTERCVSIEYNMIETPKVFAEASSASKC